MASTTILIKPETPSLLETVELSENDIVMPKSYTRFTVFYQHAARDAIEKLQTSLSTTLVSFPIVAGTMHFNAENGNISVTTNDRGVPFDVRTSSMTLESLKPFKHEEIPMDLSVTLDQALLWPLMVKITTFADGGIAVAVGMQHAIADGHSVFAFVKYWASICSMGHANGLPTPIHSRRILDPLRDARNVLQPPEFKLVDPAIVKYPSVLPAVRATMFHFSIESLARLKAEAASKSVGRFVSTQDALSALIWRCCVRAWVIPSDTQAKLGFACNGRNKTIPPQGDGYFGNSNWFPLPILDVSALTGPDGLSKAADMIRAEIEKINDDKIRDTSAWIHSIENKLHITYTFTASKRIGGADFTLTSWRFGMYDIQFFGERPMSVRQTGQLNWDGLATIFDAADGGTDVYIGLVAESMDKLEKDSEFIKFTS
ncbi:hypothetical protein SmJEL517_g04010 [Synchytrium microbalum]|uniref:Shikimate O-hydroxycinnamoyltransferase n=1 Tax=Synchytrium microbalum TaxID=1806994 RepID=A0A507C0N3_9FUNG|nr:uncharacterized protein SmJEL517_g04010 [Synchytrium microbalum]TPX32971.1 hypothetical protein SmJEL517_g04010 [Synchytrium microbalum]